MADDVASPAPCKVWNRNGGPFAGLRDGRALAYEFDVHGSHADEPSVVQLRQRVFVLLDEQMQLHQPRVCGRKRAGWYVDLFEIDVADDEVRIRDDYIDIVIGPADRPYRMRDLHDYAEALDAGAVTASRLAEGLRGTQEFLEAHLHRRSGDEASWADFPPADNTRVTDLAPFSHSSAHSSAVLQVGWARQVNGLGCCRSDASGGAQSRYRSRGRTMNTSRARFSRFGWGRRSTWRRSGVAVGAAAALVVALAGVSVLATPAAAAIPDNFFVVTDVQGANDVPAQSDLTQLGRSDTAATYKVFWSWDSTDQWTGSGQTGDACALFDYNANTRIDAVVCGQIDNPTATPTAVIQNHAPYVFRCDDSKNDRCGQPSAPQPYPTTAIAAGALGSPVPTANTGPFDGRNLITGTDPFPTVGSNTPNDASLQINVAKSYLNGTLARNLGPKHPALSGAAVLVNVCSYPSAGNGGNNNPFDCITAPGTGFLQIVKNSGAIAGAWTFGVGPATALAANQPSSYTVNTTVASGVATGSSAAIPLTVGTTRTVTETVPTGWNLASATCTIPSGSGTIPTGSLTGNVVSGITIQSGLITTCTFTNARNTGSIIVAKVDGAGTPLPGAAFSLTPAGGGTALGMTETPANSGIFCRDGLPTGDSYTLTESTVPTGYSGEGPQSVTVGSSANTCSIRLATTYTPDETVTNTRLLGSIIVAKVKATGGALAGAAFTLTPAGGGTALGMTETPANSGIFCRDGLPTGDSYTLTESTVPTGYSGEGPQSVTVGTSASTCTARLATAYTPDETVTNTRLLGTIAIKKVDGGGALLDGAAFTATLVGTATAINIPRLDAGLFCLTGLPTGGEYVITESTVPAGYTGASTIPNVTVTTTTTCASKLPGTPDLTVTNNLVNAVINIDKVDERGLALAGAVFTLFVDADADGVRDAGETTTYGTPASQTTDADGAASFENVAPGFYCVVETTTPTGYRTAAPRCVEVGVGSEAGQGDDKDLTFVNVRTHRVVVLVCHEGTDTLSSSDVTLGSVTKQSLAAGSLSAAEQKALCDTGGATFGDVEHDTTAKSLSVLIAGHVS